MAVVRLYIESLDLSLMSICIKMLYKYYLKNIIFLMKGNIISLLIFTAKELDTNISLTFL